MDFIAGYIFGVPLGFVLAVGVWLMLVTYVKRKS